MPLLYGEGGSAFIRLQEEIIKASDDQSILAWRSEGSRGGMLATSPAAFARSEHIAPYWPTILNNEPVTVSNKGIWLSLPLIALP